MTGLVLTAGIAATISTYISRRGVAAALAGPEEHRARALHSLCVILGVVGFLAGCIAGAGMRE